MLGHGANGRFREGTSDARNVDQHGRPGVDHHVEQADLVWHFQGPTGDGCLALHEGASRRSDVGHAID